GHPQRTDAGSLPDKGFVVDLDDPLASIPIDRAEISPDWDATRQALLMPFQVVSGANQRTSLSARSAPAWQGAIPVTCSSAACSGAISIMPMAPRPWLSLLPGPASRLRP